MPENKTPWPVEPDELQQFTAEMTLTATAYATHPEGADVPPPFPNPALTQE